MGVKRPGHKADHSPTSTLVPRSRICGSLQLLAHTPLWRNASLVKQMEKFTFSTSLSYAVN
jgi:hypothetical protein